jgi:ribosomal protein S18 acetylase RimI-like enzyme
MSFSLRPATVSDRPFMERVFLSASRAASAKQFDWSDAEVEHSASTRSYDFDHSTIIVVDGVEQGWQTIVMRKIDEIHIDSIFLLPEVQGRGVGTSIINGLIAEAQAKKFALSICAVKANEGARRLYERLGFVVTWSDDHRVCMVFQGLR